MNRLALSWVDVALDLEAENDRLRACIVSLLWWVGENRDLLEIAEDQLDARWPWLGERRD